MFVDRLRCALNCLKGFAILNRFLCSPDRDIKPCKLNILPWISDSVAKGKCA